jgi:hypothetical protein
MGIDHHIGSIFLVQISEQLYQYHVLEHIGVVPSVEAVAITEHGMGVMVSASQT